MAVIPVKGIPHVPMAWEASAVYVMVLSPQIGMVVLTTTHHALFWLYISIVSIQ